MCPVSKKQGNGRVVFEEALVIFARASDLIPNFTSRFILSEIIKKARANSNYFWNVALAAGNRVFYRF
ncbi:MAG: hypothetical protein EAZ90_24480 [Oscillatoriales cyanobacterium]|jgi:hypothetical protein|nr:MAG: hypothetical protein EAZ90_24480 [Oscillatoriales cyanobacterium]TAG59017.1 MAG: hypothetical protein EAZ28_13060 [Oscillatoriales cyanobacterium]